MGEKIVVLYDGELHQLLSTELIGVNDEGQYLARDPKSQDRQLKLSCVGGLLLPDDHGEHPKYSRGECAVFQGDEVPIYIGTKDGDYFWLRQEVYRHFEEWERLNPSRHAFWTVDKNGNWIYRLFQHPFPELLKIKKVKRDKGKRYGFCAEFDGRVDEDTSPARLKVRTENYFRRQGIYPKNLQH